MISLNARSLEFSAAASRVVVPIVKITTYTDRLLGTVDSTRYLSDRPLRYTYDGAVREFEPAIARTITVEEAIDHIPPSSASEGAPLGRGLSLTLANVTLDDGGTLFDALNAETLRFARVEVARLWIAPWEGESRFDLAAIGADQHEVVWKGEVARQRDAVDGALQVVECQTETPAVRFHYADDAVSNAPRDLGKRLPIVIGKPKAVPSIGWSAPGAATLSQAVDADVMDDFEFSDVRSFPASGTIQLGAEQITYSAKDDAAKTITVSARGANGTDAVSHRLGETAVEKLSGNAVWILADHACSAVAALYVRNQVTGDPVKVPETIYTVDLADTVTIPGRTVTTATFTADDLLSFLSGLVIAISEQSRDTSATTTTINNQNATGGGGGTANMRDNDDNTSDDVLNGSKFVTFPNPPGPITTQTFEIVAESAGYSAPWAKVEVGTGLQIGTIPPSQSKQTFSFTTTIASNTLILINGSNFNPLTVYEVRRDVTYETSDQLSDAEVGAGLGEALEVYADVDGAIVPLTFGPGYDLDDGTGWNDDEGTHSEDAVTEGRESQKLVMAVPAVEKVVDDSTDSEIGAETGVTLSDVMLDSVDAVRGTSGTGHGTLASFWWEPASGQDVSGEKVVYRINLEDAEELTADDGIRIRLFSGGGTANRDDWEFGSGDGVVEDQWVTLTVDVDNDPPDGGVGTFDKTDVTRFELGFPTNGSNGRRCSWALVRSVDESVPAVAQKNDLASVDLDADSDGYQLAIRGENVDQIDYVELYLSNTAGTGTTPPTDRKVLTIQGAQLTEGAFVDVEGVATIEGSPGTLSTVQTLGFRIFRLAGIVEPSVWIDDLRVSDDALSPYTVASPGDVIEHPEDAWRLILTDLVADPVPVDETTLTALSTLIPDATVAVELGELGLSLTPIVRRLGFETRTNVVLRAGVARFLAAESDYEFPAATVTLTGWKAFRIRGRDPAAIQTEHGALYDVDRSGVRSESGFFAGYRADQDLNEIPSKVSVAALAAARAKFGVRRGPVIGFLTQREAAGVEDVGGYYAVEAIRDDDDIFEIEGADPTEASQLEEGDTFQATPPRESMPRKFRVLGRGEELSGLPDFVAVEVV